MRWAECQVEIRGIHGYPGRDNGKPPICEKICRKFPRGSVKNSVKVWLRNAVYVKDVIKATEITPSP